MMLALFFVWLMLTGLLQWLTILPPWACAIIAAIPLAIWVYKRPEDF